MQMGDCVRVSGCLFWDIGAVGALRECLILPTFGHWRSMVSACVSDFAYGALM